jgi:hypothetical protein
VTHPDHGLGERVADAARHVVEALERDVESLATPTPAEAIAETAAVAHGANPDELAAQSPAAVPVDLPVEPMTDADLRADESDESDA